MALDVTGLKSGILTALKGGMFGHTTKEVAQSLVDAYDTYAMASTDPSGDAPMTLNKSKMEKILVGESSTPPASMTCDLRYTDLDVIDDQHKIYIWMLDNADATQAVKIDGKSISTATGSVVFENISDLTVYFFAFYDKDGSGTLSLGDRYYSGTGDTYHELSATTVSDGGTKRISFGGDKPLDSGGLTIGTATPVPSDPDMPAGGLPNSTTELQAAALIANSVNAYWKNGLFKADIPYPGMTVEITSTVTVPPVVAPLKTAIEAILLIKTATMDAQAGNIATALDTATKTVTVLIVGTDPQGAPITGSGMIA